MRAFRTAVALAATFLASACAKDDSGTTDTTTAATPAAGPAPVSLADVAGRWQMTSTPMSGTDTTPTRYVMTATADTTGWQIEFADGQKVPVQVMTSGDSIHIKTGTFSSQRRRNVKVATEGWARMQDGKWVGTTTARYQGTADSVLQLRTEGTRIP